MLKASSSVIVLPTSSAPLARRRSIATAFCAAVGCVSSQRGLPHPVGRPATSRRSFAAKESPSRGPEASGGTAKRSTNALVREPPPDITLSGDRVRPSSGLEETRGAHAAADAHRDDAPALLLATELEQQRADHARAGHPVRMSDRDRAAVRVELRRIDAE